MKFIAKRITAALMALTVLTLLFACGGKVSWQEKYDLGVRYLSDGEYEEAVIAFRAAIEIDPKREESYVGLVKAYVEAEDIGSAIEAAVMAAKNVDGFDIVDFMAKADDSGAISLDEVVKAVNEAISGGSASEKVDSGNSDGSWTNVPDGSGADTSENASGKDATVVEKAPDDPYYFDLDEFVNRYEKKDYDEVFYDDQGRIMQIRRMMKCDGASGTHYDMIFEIYFGYGDPEKSLAERGDWVAASFAEAKDVCKTGENREKYLKYLRNGDDSDELVRHIDYVRDSDGAWVVNTMGFYNADEAGRTLHYEYWKFFGDINEMKLFSYTDYTYDFEGRSCEAVIYELKYSMAFVNDGVVYDFDEPFDIVESNMIEYLYDPATNSTTVATYVNVNDSPSEPEWDFQGSYSLDGNTMGL